MSDDIYLCPACAREYGEAEVPHPHAVCRHDGTPLVRLSASLRPGTVIDGRYTLRAPLGQGSMGVVFRAHHHATRSDVALKLINARLADAGQVRRLMREARANNAIGHEHVATVLDHGQTRDGIAYLAMELLDGETLGELLAVQRQLEYGHAAYVAACVARALAASHALGILHRDLKPSNIFVLRARDERCERAIKVLDFGLAKTIARTRDGFHQGLLTQTSSGGMMGTPVYMSPEQYLGDDLGTTSDLYALGCVLYEMLSGRPPFVANTLFDLMRAHLDQASAPLGEHLQVPPELSALVMALLAKSPAERPQSASEVAEQLARFAIPLMVETEAIATVAPPSSTCDTIDSSMAVTQVVQRSSNVQPLFRPGLIGRDRERALLESGLEQVMAAQGARLITLEGPGGVGKSCLVEWLGHVARRRGMRVVVGHHGSSGEGGLGAVREAIEQLYEAAGLDGEALEARLAERGGGARPLEGVQADGGEPQGPAWLQGLGRQRADVLGPYDRQRVRSFLRPASAPASSAAEAALPLGEQQDLLFGALARALIAAAASRPTLVVIEDLHGGSPLERALVLRLAQLLGSTEPQTRIAVVLAIHEQRTPEAPSSVLPPSSALRAALGERYQRLYLGALEGESLARLIDTALPGADDALAQYVATMSGGNPLYTLQLLRHLVAEGVVARTGGRWVLQGEPSLPPDLAGLLDARLSGLSQGNAAAQSLLVRAALLGTRVSVSLLEVFLSCEGNTELSQALGGLLDKLVADGWLRDEESWDDDVLAFEHGFVREALVRRIGARRASRRLHMVAAEALEVYYRDRLDEYALPIAQHRVAAGQPELALPFAIRAAQRAVRDHAIEDALAAWRLAGTLCELAGDAQARMQVAWGLASLHLAQGAYDDAAAALDDSVLEDAKTLELRGDLADARASFAPAIELYERAIAGFEAQGRVLEAGAVTVKMALVVSKLGDARRARALVEPVAQLARSHAARELEANAANALAMSNQRLSEIDESRRWLEREAELRRDLADPVAQGRFAYTRGMFQVRQGHFREALEYFGEATRLLDRVGHRRGLGHSLRATAVCELELGRIGDAEAALRYALSIFETLSDRHGYIAVAQSLSDVYLMRDDPATAISWAERALEHAEALGSKTILYNVLVTLADALRADGALERARSVLERAMTMDEAASRVSAAHARTSLGHVLDRLGASWEALDSWVEALVLWRQIDNHQSVRDIHETLTHHALHREVAMALSYPHTFVLNDKGQVLQFEDDLRLTFRPGTISNEVELRIDKRSPENIDGNDAISDTYCIGVLNGTLPSTLDKQLVAHVPTSVEVTDGTTYTCWTNPYEIPYIDEWTPRPEQGEVVASKMLLLMMDVLQTFQFTRPSS